MKIIFDPRAIRTVAHRLPERIDQEIIMEVLDKFRIPYNSVKKSDKEMVASDLENIFITLLKSNDEDNNLVLQRLLCEFVRPITFKGDKKSAFDTKMMINFLITDCGYWIIGRDNPHYVSIFGKLDRNDPDFKKKRNEVWDDIVDGLDNSSLNNGFLDLDMEEGVLSYRLVKTKLDSLTSRRVRLLELLLKNKGKVVQYVDIARLLKLSCYRNGDCTNQEVSKQIRFIKRDMDKLLIEAGMKKSMIKQMFVTKTNLGYLVTSFDHYSENKQK